MFYSQTGHLYAGDMQPGDRLATQAEIDAWNASRAPKPIDQIRAIESTPEITDAMTRASRQLLLGTWFERVKAKPAAAGMSNDQIEAWCRANDKSYKALAEAEDAIKLLRAAV